MEVEHIIMKILTSTKECNANRTYLTIWNYVWPVFLLEQQVRFTSNQLKENETAKTWSFSFKKMQSPHRNILPDPVAVILFARPISNASFAVTLLPVTAVYLNLNLKSLKNWQIKVK